jgi:hypothetical protein
LNQNNAIILTGGEGLLLIRGFHVAALRDSDRQARICELRALLTAFDLTAHDLFPPADVEQVEPAPTTLETRNFGNLLSALIQRGIGEKDLHPLLAAKPAFDHIDLLDLGKAIIDLGHAWKSHERRVERREPAHENTAPPSNDPGPMPDFLRRAPTNANAAKGSNGKAAS